MPSADSGVSKPQASEAALDSAKAFLQQTNEGGLSLYDHLANTVRAVLEARPDRAVDDFENISYRAKGAVTAAKAASAAPDAPDAAQLREVEQAVATLQLFNSQAKSTPAAGAAAKKKPAGSDGEEAEEEEEEEDEGEERVPAGDDQVKDFTADAQMFEWAGAGIGAEESFRVGLALRKLLDTQPLENVRFFGKIHGLDADYLVAETEFKAGARQEDEEEEDDDEDEPEEEVDDAASVDSEPEDPEDDPETAGSVVSKAVTQLKVPKPKPSGTVPAEVEEGLNFHVYFVCQNTATANWVRLPDVTPDQIQGARAIRKFLTGNLDAPVVSYPPFPGTERNFLRAQIARIAAATVIAPAGAFLPPPEDGGALVAEPNMEFEGADLGSYLDLENWQHKNPAILSTQGRCTAVPVEKPLDGGDDDVLGDEEDGEEEEPELEQGPPLLNAVAEDSPMGKEAAWSASALGQQLSPQQVLSDAASVAVVRSARWPGAVAVAKGVRYANLYIGFGVQRLPEAYAPTFPARPEDGPSQEARPEGEEEDEEEEEEEEPLEDEDEDGDGFGTGKPRSKGPSFERPDPTPEEEEAARKELFPEPEAESEEELGDEEDEEDEEEGEYDDDE